MIVCVKFNVPTVETKTKKNKIIVVVVVVVVVSSRYVPSIKQTNLKLRKIRKKTKLHHKMCDSKIHVLEGPRRSRCKFKTNT